MLFDVLLELVDLLAVQVDAHFVSGSDQVRVDLHVHFITIFVIIFILLSIGSHALHVILVVIVAIVPVTTLLPTTVLLIRVITLHMLLLPLLMQSSGLLKALLVDIVLFVIDTTVSVIDLSAVLLLDHALALELLLAHLIKAIFFIVSVRHNPSDQLRVDLAQIDGVAIFVNHHA